jgi:hypothetical protein
MITQSVTFVCLMCVSVSPMLNYKSLHKFTGSRSGKCSDRGCNDLNITGDVNVLEEYSTSSLSVEVTVVKMQSSYLGRLRSKMETRLREVERSWARFEFCEL